MGCIPGVILATAAAIIASQALITGSFTIFSEAMSLIYGLTRKLIILPG
jgi:KUP system potassium uptake protein